MKTVRFGIFSLVLLIAVLASSSTETFAQDLNPIRWTVKKENPTSTVKAGDKFKVQVIATIDDGWHLYSLEQPAGGPIPTRITLPDNQKFKLAGDVESPAPQIFFDPNFNLDTQFYETEAVFTLPIEVAKDSAAGENTLSVNVFFQTCNDSTCLPPKSLKLAYDITITGAAQTLKVSEAGEIAAPVKTSTVNAKQSADAKAIEFAFVDFNGKQRKFSEFRGKFVLLDFWATWCKPCLADIPKLQKLYEKHKANNFEIIGMDSETVGEEAESPDPEFAKETAARAKQIVATRGVTWTQATSETAVPVAMKIFGVKSLPTKILISPEGKIIAAIGEKDDLMKIVGDLLTEKK